MDLRITQMPKRLYFLAVLALLTACTQTNVFNTDLTKQEGVYIVGYTADKDLRKVFEDQLSADLAANNIKSYASYKDIDDITQSDAAEIMRLTSQKKAAAVVVINQVRLTYSASVELEPNRISPEHADLIAFYEHIKTQVVQAPKTGEATFAEVNTFAVDGQKTRLVWSGTTWSFDADGAGGAITAISDIVASELTKVRDRYR
jgi:hypothetical protein